MTFHVKIICSTEILINFDVNIPFLPYQNQNAFTLYIYILKISRYVIEKQTKTKLSPK